MENIRQRNIRRPSSVGRVTVMEEIVLSCWVNIVCFCNCKLIFQRFFFKRSIGCRSSGWNYGRNGLQNEPAIWRTYTKGEDNASSDFTKKKTLQQQPQYLPSFACRQQVSLKFFKYQQLSFNSEIFFSCWRSSARIQLLLSSVRRAAVKRHNWHSTCTKPVTASKFDNLQKLYIYKF